MRYVAVSYANVSSKGSKDNTKVEIFQHPIVV